VTRETERLVLRRLAPEDAPFIVTLLNDPAFLEHIGDRGVRNIAQAIEYLERGPFASYARHGFGLNAVVLRATGEPIGICGLLQREDLDAPDLGFAFLPAYRGQGYAYEAAIAVLEDAARTLACTRVLAVTQPGNQRSIALLERLGFSPERLLTLAHSEHGLQLFSRPL
jgi:RimJ/RimL family protein N-acetyltransferase